MNQLRSIYTSLSPKQRGSIVLICLALIAGFFYISRWEHERGFEPLYKELTSEDAAAVVAKLKERGVEFRLGENGSSVLVASDKAAEMRLEMAGAGLVRSGRPGFELFDKVNFGVTDFAEQVNYRRALEGELERSVVSLAEVEKARVHLTFKRESVYTDSRQPAKASVLIKLKPFARLSQQNVQAIAHLVSSAVEGLTPDSVSILDMNGNLLGRPRRTPSESGEELNDYTLEYQQTVEKQLLAKINSTLEPLLGPDRFRAGVSAECDLSSSDESEEIFDPEHSVMTSSQKSEDSSTHTPAGGVPGTASALPRPNDAGKNQVGTSRKTESVAYQTSRRVRHRKTPQGVVKRVSVSVLLDNEVEWQGQGKDRKKVIIPPTPERLKSIHDLVAGVVGFSQDRGDQIVVEVLPFEMNLHGDPLADQAPAPVAKDWKQKVTNVVQDPKQIIPLSAILAALFVIGVGVWQFKRFKKAKAARKSGVVNGLPALPEPSGGPTGALADAIREQEALEAEEMDPVARLAALVEEKPEQCAVVLKQWLAEQEVAAQ